jgi:hypothetical protein
MSLQDRKHNPKPYGELELNDSGRRLMVYYPYNAGLNEVGPPPSPTPFPTPTPSPFVGFAQISPFSGTQYTNIVLSASTNLSSPTFTWTLTDFYDTNDNAVTSFVGQTLTEGYFSSTGSSNAVVVVTGTQGSATGSTFSVSEFDVMTTTPDWWYDTSDISTITFRSGTDYIEQIDDKSGNNRNVVQNTASRQPLYSASSVNNSLSAATFNGIDEIMNYNGSSIPNISGNTTMGVGQNRDKALQPGNPGGAGLGSPFYRFYDPTSSGQARYLSNTSASWIFARNYVFDRNDTRTNVDGGAEEVIWYRRENETGTINDAVINGHVFPSSAGTSYEYDGGSLYFGWFILTADYQLKLWGEIGEMIHHHRTITDTEQIQLDRYLQYKWFGGKNF